MKIHFDNTNLNSASGPNTFANRLARRLFESGHEVQFTGTGADVSLVFIEPTGAPLAPKVVQRLDGIWFKPEEFSTKNVGIKRLYERADVVVFQSLFDHNMVVNHWGKKDIARVIGNGIELKPVTEITIPKLAEMRARYDQLFVCSSNWHPQKRLKANVALFDHIRKTQHPNSCLIIMGDHPDYRAAGMNVFYTGPVGPEVYMQVYSAANWMLHLAWADHCPNVVVEALSQATPIICSEVGGTKELVGAYGIVLREQPYDFELYDYDSPPDIDVTQCGPLPSRHELDFSGVPNIDIAQTAKAYVELFETLLKQ